MSTASCPACGAELEAHAGRCLECGEIVRHRKRGELAGVRLDPARIERAMQDLSPTERGHGWSSTRDRPSTDRMLRVEPASASFGENPQASDVRESATRSAEEPAASPSIPPAPPSAPPEAPTPRTMAAGNAAVRVEPALPRPRRSTPPPPPLDAEVVLDYPAPPDESAQVRTAVQAPEPPRPHVAHGRPPVLASEALLRDLAPAKPAPRALRYASALLGLAGVALVMALTGTRGVGVPFSAAFVALVLLSLPPMPYAARAASVLTIAGSGLMLVLATHPNALGQRASLLLTLPITLLATGLYFRAFHRASALARILVAFGVLTGIAFLEVSGALRHLTMTDTAWQSWAPRLIGVPFGMLLMLSLLAFMDARTTAGCSIWASCMLVFHGLYTSVHLLQAVWPKGASGPDLTRVGTSAALSELCAPLLAALLSLALAQVLATTMAHAIGHAARSPAQRPA